MNKKIYTLQQYKMIINGKEVFLLHDRVLFSRI